MLKNEPKQLSIYSILYDRIPKKHILKLINNAVDFSFINSLLASSYCKYYGRPAKEPEMMVRLLIIQYLYNYSDVKLIQEVAVNLAFMWFVGINPDEELPDASLLAKFRTQRMHETSLDEIIKEIIRQCVDKGIIKGTGISIDATHTKANTNKLFPERIMKRLAKKIFKEVKNTVGEIPENINTEIPDYKKIEDKNLSKEIMKDYLENVINEVSNVEHLKESDKVARAIEEAKETLSDPKFLQQKGVRSLVDKDARVGYKSKTDSFFGYKVEYAMLADERIITSVNVQSGSYVDGTKFKELYEATKDCGIEIKEAYGDKAYFRKPILDFLKSEEVEAVIPVSEMVYRIDDSKFNYNKDSDQWICYQGNTTMKKVHKKDSKGNESFHYHFENEQCKNCSARGECIKGKAKKKILSMSINTPEIYAYVIKNKTEDFLLKYKKRASIEWKNGEMKRFHGMAKAKGYSLKSMQTQAKLTALVVNLKRIASLLSSNLKNFILFWVKVIILIIKQQNYKIPVLNVI